MNMKKTILILLFLTSLFLVKSIKAQQLSPEVQSVYDACLEIQSAIGSGSENGLRSANAALKKCKTKYFGSFKPMAKDELSLMGHFVFDYEFVDSLIAGHQVYEYAERYAHRSCIRHVTSCKGCVMMRTFALKEESTSVYKVRAFGHQELAFVAEPQGFITVRIHDVTNNKWYSDKTNEAEGESSRVLVFDLPDKSSVLQVEVMNLSDHDISFVVISK